MKKIFLLLTVLILGKSLYLNSQNISSIDMLSEPLNNKYSLSGQGGTNATAFKSQELNASGLLDFAYNIKLKGDEYSSKIKTLLTAVKYNATAQNVYIVGSDLTVKDILFVENQNLAFVSLHKITWKDKSEDDEEKKINLRNYFLDFSVAPIYIQNSINPENEGFYNFNILGGFQLSHLYTNTGIGSFAFDGSIQTSYINIYDMSSGDNSFDELLGYTERLSRNYLGFGGKLVFQINDFALYFELRKYKPLDNNIQLPNFTDRTVFSIGAKATGTIFRNHQKSNNSF